jgi:hypothetical protein
MLRLIVGAFSAMALVPATAAAAPPTLTTGGVADVTQSTVTLAGSVNPHGNATAVHFEYGINVGYGGITPETDAGAGTAPKNITAAVGALTPNTKYHYRFVARYGAKIVNGKDRTFTTKKQPLGLTLGATPATVKWRGVATLAGNLSGTDNKGRQVILKANPYPYTQGFAQVGNPLVVQDDAGTFSFPVAGIAVNTQYQVQVPGEPAVVSPVIFVGVRVGVQYSVKKGKHRHFRFHGRLVPGSDGATVTIQRQVGAGWKNVASTFSHHLANDTSSFSRRVKLRKGGHFRIAVTGVNAAYVENVGRTVRIR